ncbi:hypothetical protein CF327_g2374 [Tilletia walkeri]|nr:hypothetical protein CF327_g2374 [Tilletia walkeri]
MPFVLPGDIVHSAVRPLGSIAPDTQLKLGPGLLPERVSSSSSSSSDPTPTLVATRAGIVGHVPGRTITAKNAAASSSSTAERSTKRAKTEEGKGKGVKQDGLWVEVNTRRYIPAPSDTIIGQITARGPDFYTVSLLSAHTAALPALAFEGATKRHKPNIRVGAIVYARVISAERHTDPELSCVNPVTGKADGMGELKVGEREVGCAMLFKISLGLASSLLHPSHPLLPRLAAHFPFESAIGHNGFLWARTSQPSHLIALGRILERAEQRTDTPGRTTVKEEMDVDDEEQEEDEEAILSSRAQDVARSRGALSKEEIKQIVGPFL